MTFDNGFELFFNSIKSYAAAATVRDYEVKLARFGKYLIENKLNNNIFDLGRQDIINYITYLSCSGCKNTSIRSYMRSINSFFNFCKW